MLSKLLFGVQTSPQTKMIIGLAWVVVVLGVVVGVTQDWKVGLLSVIVGLVAVAVLSRGFASHDAKVATSEQLDRITGDVDPDVLEHLVDHAKQETSPNKVVVGEVDPEELQHLRDADGA
ncbi:MAG: hypothetical protein MUF83_12330 [Acidimicrobiales bacterium]|nr:hypothetical protein [Acidimicrobiales bacterium]